MTQQPLIDEPPRFVIIRVYGVPQPKGSFRALTLNGRATAVPYNAKSKAWEKAVKLAASRSCRRYDWLPFDRPCSVTFEFFLRRPQKPRFRRPATKPDYDKLVRSTGDALSGVAYVDDARVVEAHTFLRYVDQPSDQGVLIEVAEVRE
jgi:crossover junction endodeoxyribonuclease RusA